MVFLINYIGRCTSNRKYCSSTVMCPYDKPILCSDYRCVDDIDKCPEEPDCGENEYYCNGKCVNSYLNCPALPVCEGGVLCPNMKCAKFDAEYRDYYYGDANFNYSTCVNRLINVLLFYLEYKFYAI